MKKIINNGLFIVIDGTDGSGKQTQTKLLHKKLTDEGFEVLSVSFPRYGTPSAQNVEKYLNGDFGDDPNKIDAYTVSEYYAEDRSAHSAEIKAALRQGQIVISDRYVTANMGHQGSKFTDSEERNKYLQWLYELEYRTNNIPEPNINFILHVPTAVSQELIKTRGEKQDIHENNLEHLYRAEKTYLELPGLFPHFSLIECCKNGDLLSPHIIHNIICEQLSPLLKTQDS